MKQMKNKKARQIILDYFGVMAEEKRSLYDCYGNPTPYKKSSWENIFKVALCEHRASRVQIYGYTRDWFSVVYYGDVDGKQGIIYITPWNRYLIPDSFIQKVVRE